LSTLRQVRRRPAVPWPFVALTAAVVVVWIGLAAYGGFTLDLGPGTASVSPAGAAAAAGAALLAGAVTRPVSWALGSMLAGLLLLPPALAVAASGGEARPLVAAAVLAVAFAVTTGGRNRPARMRAAGLAGGGTALVAAAVFSHPGAGFALSASSDEFAAALVAASVLLVLSGTGGTVGVPGLKPLLPVGLVAGLVGAAALGGEIVPLLAGAAAAGVCAVRPAAAAGLYAVALAALPGGQPAAALVGAGAVLAVALERDWAVVAALPGAIASVDVLLLPGDALPRVIVGTTAVLVVGQLAARLVPSRTESASDEPRGSRLAAPIDLARLPGIGPRRAERHRLPALVLGVWLLVAPGTWAWAGETRLRDYDLGAGRALAAALVLMTALSVADQVLARRRPTIAE
jgi:hypothetical protein